MSSSGILAEGGWHRPYRTASSSSWSSQYLQAVPVSSVGGPLWCCLRRAWGGRRAWLGRRCCIASAAGCREAARVSSKCTNGAAPPAPSTHQSPCSSAANSRQLGCAKLSSAAPGQCRSSQGCSAARLPVEAAPAPRGDGGSPPTALRPGLRPRGEPHKLPRVLGCTSARRGSGRRWGGSVSSVFAMLPLRWHAFNIMWLRTQHTGTASRKRAHLPAAAPPSQAASSAEQAAAARRGPAAGGGWTAQRRSPPAPRHAAPGRCMNGQGGRGREPCQVSKRYDD